MTRFTKVPADLFNKIVVNAGFVTRSVNFETGVIGEPISGSTGGFTFNPNVTYSDYGEDVDNCPKNTKELKRIEGYDPTLSGNAVSIDSDFGKLLVGAADVMDLRNAAQPTKLIRPRMNLDPTSDFPTLYYVGDYSADNNDRTGGGLIIELKNCFNQTGFQLTTTDRGKGQFAYEFHAHSSIATQDEVPYNLYLMEPVSTP